MTRLTTMLIAVALLLTGGLAYGQQETGPHFDHLKSHQAIIGTWRYEGPLPEDMPGFAEKGSDWRRPDYLAMDFEQERH